MVQFLVSVSCVAGRFSYLSSPGQYSKQGLTDRNKFLSLPWLFVCPCTLSVLLRWRLTVLLQAVTGLLRILQEVTDPLFPMMRTIIVVPSTAVRVEL